MIRVLALFGSFKIALSLLLSIMVLVILGTLYQSQMENFDVQEKFFRSFFVFWRYSSWNIPLFPGGYLLGGFLLINLLSALLLNIRRFWNKLGIYLIHAGLILLLVGETIGGILSSETILPLAIGEKKNYSFDINDNSLTSFGDENGYKYFPFWIELTEFKHEKHPGIDTPKSFSSSLKLYSNEGQLIKEAFISMNNPLKYQGYTFFQSGFGGDDQQSILKVVKNPASFSPYLFSCLVIAGFIYQLIYGFSFYRKRRIA